MRAMGGRLMPRPGGAVLADARDVVNFIWTHPANKGRRMRVLLRAAGFQARARVLGKRTCAQLGRKSAIWADLHRTSASKVVYANPPDHPEMIVWRNSLAPGDLFLDVGANIGSYAIWAGELGAEVIALEPAGDTFALLTENIALNGYPITAVQAAAGAACGTARLTTGLDSANRLDPAGHAETDMVTVDSVLGGRAAAGMKVDVEGFEMDVLAGCERALSEHRISLIQLEWNATSQNAAGIDRRPVADVLARHGYSLYRPDRCGDLVPIVDISFGPDVFARLGPQPDSQGNHREYIDPREARYAT
jgi:FkbM family methyltransferase